MVFHGFSWFFMVFHGFSWFQVGFSCFFMVFHGSRCEARHETYRTPKLVTTRRSILGPPAEGRPGPSDNDDDDDDDHGTVVVHDGTGGRDCVMSSQSGDRRDLPSSSSGLSDYRRKPTGKNKMWTVSGSLYLDLRFWTTWNKTQLSRSFGANPPYQDSKAKCDWTVESSQSGDDENKILPFGQQRATFLFFRYSLYGGMAIIPTWSCSPNHFHEQVGFGIWLANCCATLSDKLDYYLVGQQTIC